MKKSLFVLAAALCFVSASCHKENSVAEPKGFCFEASLEVPGKTVMDNMISYWDGLESIAVFDESDVKKLFEGTASKQTSLTFVEKDPSIPFTGNEYYAVYPSSAAESAAYSASVVSGVLLKRDQNAFAGSYDPSAHIAFAQSSTSELSFMNAVSLLAFTVEGEGVSEVRIYANAESEYMTGIFSYDYSSKSASLTSEQSAYVSVKGDFENGETYYAAVLPGTFSAGISVELYKDGVAGKKKSSSSSFELKRSCIVDLGKLKYEAAVTEKSTSHTFASPDFGLEGEVGAELYKNNGPAVEGDIKWYLTVNIPEPIYFWKAWGLQIGIGWHENTIFHVGGMNLWTEDITGQIKSVSVTTSDSDTVANSELYVLVNGVQFGDKKTPTNDMTKYTFTDSTLPSGKIEIVWNSLSENLSYYLKSVEVVYQE